MREGFEDVRVGIVAAKVDPWLFGTRKRRCFQSGLASTITSSRTGARCCSIGYSSLMGGQWTRYVYLIHFTCSLLPISIPFGLPTAVSYQRMCPTAPHRRRPELPLPKRTSPPARSAPRQFLLPRRIHLLLERPPRPPRREIQLRAPRDFCVPLRHICALQQDLNCTGAFRADAAFGQYKRSV